MKTFVQCFDGQVRQLDVRKWDGVDSWEGRAFHACILCDPEKQTGGVTTPINVDYVNVHPHCYDERYSNTTIIHGESMNSYQNVNVGNNQTQGIATTSSTSLGAPTRFASISQRLEVSVKSLYTLIERANRVVDRLGGSVPEPVVKSVPRQEGNCIAASLEAGIDDVDMLVSRLSGTVERLESL
jgi:hypothetical protein